MAERIKTGTVLVKEETLLPESLQVESEPYSKGWRLVKGLDGDGLERKIHEAGWTLFFMAGEVSATVLGSDSAGSARRAVKKLMMDANGFNCLEISRVAGKRFLGLPCVAASGHARHLQQSMFLVGAEQPEEFDRAELGAVPAQA